jgi:hypothetical protein
MKNEVALFLPETPEKTKTINSSFNHSWNESLLKNPAFKNASPEDLQRLTPAQIKAIILCAEGSFNRDDLARSLNVTHDTLKLWGKDYAYMRVLNLVQEYYLNQLMHLSIVRKSRRLEIKQRLVDKMEQVIEQRVISVNFQYFSSVELEKMVTLGYLTEEGKTIIERERVTDLQEYARLIKPHLVSVPGIDTGIVNPDGSVDTQLISSLNSLLDSVARETGQIVDRSEIISQNLNVNVGKFYSDFDVEDI